MINSQGGTHMRDKRVDDKMEVLIEQQQVLEEAIAWHKSKVALNDWRKEWYENAMVSYTKKLEKVISEQKNAGGYREPEVQGGASKSLVKEEGVKQTHHKTSEGQKKVSDVAHS